MLMGCGGKVTWRSSGSRTWLNCPLASYASHPEEVVAFLPGSRQRPLAPADAEPACAAGGRSGQTGDVRSNRGRDPSTEEALTIGA
jgi:hypothetical protein